LDVVTVLLITLSFIKIFVSDLVLTILSSPTFHFGVICLSLLSVCPKAKLQNNIWKNKNENFAVDLFFQNTEK
jgi:hypothetical protein